MELLYSSLVIAFTIATIFLNVKNDMVPDKFLLISFVVFSGYFVPVEGYLVFYRILGGLLFFAISLIISVAKGNAIGGGIVKLSGVLGFILGIKLMAFVFLATVLLVLITIWLVNIYKYEWMVVLSNIPIFMATISLVLFLLQLQGVFAI
ncbi:MAG TPA: hypothetical protein VIG40_05500 [Tissierellaceae bacterium]